jgi:hypothetical protein
LSELASLFLRKRESDCRRFPFVEAGGKIMASYEINLLYELTGSQSAKISSNMMSALAVRCVNE